MKSFIFAAVLSLIIIASGTVLSQKIESATATVSQGNQNLHNSLENKDIEKSINALNSAEKEFKNHKVLFEATSDHEELLRIELHYAAIRDFIYEEQFGDALASCSEIDLLLSHLPENFKVRGENIL